MVTRWLHLVGYICRDRPTDPIDVGRPFWARPARAGAAGWLVSWWVGKLVSWQNTKFTERRPEMEGGHVLAYAGH